MAHSVFFVVFLSFCLLASCLGVDPTIKCVVGDAGNTWFSVLFEDNGSITDDEQIKIQYKSAANVAEVDTACPNDKWVKEYFNAADYNGLADDSLKYTMDKPGASTANSGTHSHTRILIRLNPCSIHETVDVDATGNEKAQQKQIFTAQLQMGPTTWAMPYIYDLKCSFYQSSSDDTLTVSSELGQTLAADEQNVEAQLKLFKEDENGDKQEVTESSGVLNVKLGETIYLQANIKGDIDVETGFKYCKICSKQDCSDAANLQIDLMAQYAGDGSDASKTAANEQMNCLHSDIRSNSKFVVTPPADGKPFAEFQYPAFRYSESENTAELYLKCAVSICKAGATSPCRGGCVTPGAGRRRRRSAGAEIEPLHSMASLAIKIVTPESDSCAAPGPVKRAARRASCSNGDKLGSVCHQACQAGYESAGGRRAATRMCQERITEKIGAIYFGAAPKWTPENAGCEDIDECLTNPCPNNSICENTIGSYRCL